MSGKSGTQDWFYHAPSKREDKQPVDYPAASQIPLIGGDLFIDSDRDDGGMKRGWLRETDSKYVRLAKMGGRKDLLTIRTPPPKAESARAYPRVDWFDHQVENEPVDTSPRKVYLPDYMVYEAHNPANPVVDEMAGKRLPPRRAPYSLQDGISAFKRDGSRVTDKTVKLNEEVPHSKRFAKRDKKSDVEQMNKALASRRESLTQRQKKAVREEPDDPVIFGKLLSMGYQQDWNEQRDRNYGQHHKRQENQPYKTETQTNIEPVTTEYRELINKTGKQIHTTKGGAKKSVKCSTRRVAPVTKTSVQKERSSTTNSLVDRGWSPSNQSNSDAYQQQLQMTKVEI